jgi:hypothetical protein
MLTFPVDLKNTYTGGLRYMQEIGTPKIGSHITNSHLKRPRINVNLRIGSKKIAIFQLHLCKIADKKAAYNEGHLYIENFNIAFDSMFSMFQC